MPQPYDTLLLSSHCFLLTTGILHPTLPHRVTSLLVLPPRTSNCPGVTCLSRQPWLAVEAKTRYPPSRTGSNRSEPDLVWDLFLLPLLLFSLLPCPKPTLLLGTGGPQRKEPDSASMSNKPSSNHAQTRMSNCDWTIQFVPSRSQEYFIISLTAPPALNATRAPFRFRFRFRFRFSFRITYSEIRIRVKPPQSRPTSGASPITDLP